MCFHNKSVMDISFDIQSTKGDHLRVALSYYDKESLQTFTEDPLVLTLVFYDVTLVRMSGNGIVGIKALKAVCDILYRFMKENETAVLCFYCDDLTDVARRHSYLTPQEYRSQLFSRMFDMHIRSNKNENLINYQVKLNSGGDTRFAHFIAAEKHLSAVKLLAGLIMEK